MRDAPNCIFYIAKRFAFLKLCWAFRITLMLGTIEGRRRRGGQGWDGWMASLTGWAWENFRDIGKNMAQYMGLQRVGHDRATERHQFKLTKQSSCQSLLVAQLCPTFCDPMDCSPPGSSVHGILQAAMLEWIAIPFSRVSSQPRDQACVSCSAGGAFRCKLPGKPCHTILS